MTAARALPAALLLMAMAATGALACPNDRLLERIRGASRAQVEQLAGDATRVETDLAPVPGRTLGYEVQGIFRIKNSIADAVEAAIGRNDSYACKSDAPRATFAVDPPVQIGFLFGTGVNAVAVVLHLPEGLVEMQVEGGERSNGTLSQAGQRRWELAVRLLAEADRSTAEEFYVQMRPPETPPR